MWLLSDASMGKVGRDLGMPPHGHLSRVHSFNGFAIIVVRSRLSTPYAPRPNIGCSTLPESVLFV